MLKNKRFLGVFLAVLFMLSVMPMGSAMADTTSSVLTDSEGAIIDSVCSQVVDSYAEYYTIPSISGWIEETIQEPTGTRYTVCVSFTKILLAESASDLPYIQGLEAAAMEIEDAGLRAEALANIEARKLELNDLYIGVEQEENSTFSVFVPSIRSKMANSNYEISFVSEFGTLDVADFAPASKAELYQEGKANGEAAMQSQTLSITPFAVKTNPSSATAYDRVKARDYARKYSCGNCTTSPHSCRNTAYTFYNGADCANFVSQAIHDGGIQTESNWKAGHTNWIATGYNGTGLTVYMVDQGFFFKSTDKNKAFAGSIINWTSYSHVGMVDANDTVTMTYCAHTNDRKSSSFKNITDVNFYIPVWDSYAGQYTPR